MPPADNDRPEHEQDTHARFEALEQRVLDLERRLYGYDQATGQPLPSRMPRPPSLGLEIGSGGTS